MTMEIGISDFRKMVIKVFKIFQRKQKPKIIHYRNYKTFNANLFKEEFSNELLSIDDNNAELVELPILFYQYLISMHPIKKYEKHPSINKIKKKMKNKNMPFSFNFVTKETMSCAN